MQIRSRAVRPLFSWAVLGVIWAVALPLVSGCGGAQPAVSAPPAPAVDLDGDAIALLPPGPVVVGLVDVHALCANPTLGPQIASLVDSRMPLGEGAGFVASRDLDQVILASYSLASADEVAILRGRFDAKAVDRAAGKSPAQPHSSGFVAATPYAGFTMYTVGDIGFAVLTSKTAVAGSGPGLRHTLDRIKDGRIHPELAEPMMETLRTKGVVAALAADFGGSSLASVPGLPIPPWVGAVKTVQGTAALQPPGVQVSGSVSYDSPQRASSGADSMRQLLNLVNTMAGAGVLPKLLNLVIQADGVNVRLAFAVEESALRSLLQRVPEWLPSPNLGAARASNEQH